MQPSPNPPAIKLNVKRRRVLATTAAAISLAGCGMLGGPQAAAPASPEQIEAERRVKAYQSDIESALDRVDRERLRAAAEKKATVPVLASNPTSPTPVTSTTPAAPVILASANAEPEHGTAVIPVAIAKPAPVAAAPATPATPAAAARAEPEPLPLVSAPVTPVTPATPVVSATPPTPATVIPPTVAEPAATPTRTLVAPVATPIASAEPVQPLAAPASMGVVVAPMSGDAPIPTAIISPFTPPSTPSASAMTAMTAMVTPTQMAVAEPAATPAAPAEATLDDALNVLRKNVGEHPTLNTALALALLDGSNGGDALKKLPDADQKVMTDLLSALEAMKSKTASATLAERAAPLVDAARHWQEDADLALPRLVLATRVDSFGVFTPVAGTFEQGKRHTVIIYCEVANFASKKGDDGWYTTKLSQQETLFTEDGLLIWRPNVEDVEDRSLNQRHDFYLVKKLTIPETLAAGRYTLRMSVTDRTTNKIKLVEMAIELQTK